eukprot:2150743-Prymnesium_polylepis.1
MPNFHTVRFLPTCFHSHLRPPKRRCGRQLHCGVVPPSSGPPSLPVIGGHCSAREGKAVDL